IRGGVCTPAPDRYYEKTPVTDGRFLVRYDLSPSWILDFDATGRLGFPGRVLTVVSRYAEQPLRRRCQRQGIEPVLVPIAHAAVLERPARVEQNRHVLVGMVEEPYAHPGGRVLPQMLPG